MKRECPILGEHGEWDYLIARSSRLAKKRKSCGGWHPEVSSVLFGAQRMGHLRTPQYVVPPVTISFLIGVLLSSLYNPNLAWDEYCHLVALAEVEFIGMMAQ